MNQTYTHEQIKAMSEEQVAQELEKDFLERDGDTFVRIRRSGRIGWEETLPAGTAYSEKMMHPETTEDLLRAAYRHADDMITAMDTPYKVVINVTRDVASTTFSTVNVPSICLTDESMPLGKRLDVFTGYAVHEGAHLLYTDTRVRLFADQIRRFLHNAIEDEMIEIRLGEEKPGFANFLCAAKYHCFGRYEAVVEEMMNKAKRKQNRLVDAMNALLKMIRYPARLTAEEIASDGRLLLEARQILTPYPGNTAESKEAADRIYGLLVETYKDEADQQQQQSPQDPSEQDGSNESSGTEGGGQKEEDGNEGNDGGTSSGMDENKSDSDNSQKEDKGNQSENQKEDSKGQKGGESSGNGASSDRQKDGNPVPDSEKTRNAIEQLQKDFNEIKDALKELVRDSAKKLDREEIAKEFIQNNSLLARECTGELEKGKSRGAVIMKPGQNSQRYLSALAAVKKHVPAVGRILKSNGTEYSTCLKGMRSGRLDTAKLAEAFQGVQSVYTKEAKVKADRMTVALLIDESGSMSGEKNNAALNTAVLFNEALKTVQNVRLHIYGYTCREFPLELTPYAEPGKTSRRGFELGCIKASGGTPTALAIEEAVRRIGPADEKTLLMIISDGQPDGSISEVALQTAKAEKKGIRVMGISIDDGLPVDSLKKMYGNYVKYTDMGTMVRELAKTLKHEVLGKTGRRMEQ